MASQEEGQELTATTMMRQETIVTIMDLATLTAIHIPQHYQHRQLAMMKEDDDMASCKSLVCPYA